MRQIDNIVTAFIRTYFCAIFHKIRPRFIFFYFASLEPPDVTGSSLTLGTAGSRRTVYLIDDNAAKLTEQKNMTAGSGGGSASNNNASNNNVTDATGGSVESSPPPPPPSTFLMFNRISNVIGGNVGSAGAGSLSPSHSSNGGEKATSSGTAKDKKKGSEDGSGGGKETAVWYEYGCV